MLLSGEKPWGTHNTVTHLLLLCDCLAPCETELRRAWWSIFVQSKGTLLYFVVLLNARLSSGTGSREGRAGLPSLQTTAEKCSTNWRWSPPLSELFQGDRWVSLAAMAADFDWIGYACLCNCSHSCIELNTELRILCACDQSSVQSHSTRISAAAHSEHAVSNFFLFCSCMLIISLTGLDTGRSACIMWQSKTIGKED